MKDIITVLLFLGVCILPSIIKVMKEAKNPQSKKMKQVLKTPSPISIQREEMEANTNAEMRKTEPKVPKEQEYFTYETMDDDLTKSRVSVEKEEKSNMQSAENERENIPELTLTEEEIYKGVIYSEIFKRKFN